MGWSLRLNSISLWSWKQLQEDLVGRKSRAHDRRWLAASFVIDMRRIKGESDPGEDVGEFIVKIWSRQKASDHSAPVSNTWCLANLNASRTTLAEPFFDCAAGEVVVDKRGTTFGYVG